MTTFPSLILSGSCTGLFLASSLAAAAEWQWVTDVPGYISAETGKAPHAFLWIPPTCTQVRGVLVGQHNMEEEGILEHARMRQTLSELGFAEIWLSPGMGIVFTPEEGTTCFNGMLQQLARASGYAELEQAPVVSIGHSAYASFPWQFANWQPERTLAAISISGQWPWVEMREKDQGPIAWRPDSLDGVPGLIMMGEYEAGESRIAQGAGEVAKHPRWPFTGVVEAGAGHFDFSARKVGFIADYIRTIARMRLPSDPPRGAPVRLKPIDPQTQGWRVERGSVNHGPTISAAPVGSWPGKVTQSFWAPDQATAAAIDGFATEEKGKRVQLLGYRQKNGITPQSQDHSMVHLRFEPEDDGMTMRITPVFLDTVPKGAGEGWSGLPAGSPIGHSTTLTDLRISRICGSVAQLGPETFTLNFSRVGLDNPKRARDFWLLAEHPGDATYRRSVQQAQLAFPLKLTAGAEQSLTFPEIPDQHRGTTTVPLHATSSAGAKVHYYVLAGPAEVVDDERLELTSLPPRANLPLTITVVAWQWGRTIAPQLRSAEPVTRSFRILP
jgi:hypothetical protein